MRPGTLKIFFLSFGFIGMISFPLMNGLFDLVQDHKSEENRRHSPKPFLNIKKLDPFPQAYEKYYNDTFSLRNRLILNYERFKCLVLKKSPFPEMVVVGKNQWLYARGDIDPYTAKQDFTSEELHQYKTELLRRKNYLAQKGCRFYFMIVPCKTVVYPEFLPSEIYRFSNHSIGEKLQQYLQADANLSVIDLYPVLRKNKSKQNTYYKLDNHWSRFGACCAAAETIKEMRRDFPLLKIFPPDSFTIHLKTVNGGNTSKMIGNLDIFEDKVDTLIKKSPLRASVAAKAGYSDKKFPYPWDFESVREIKNSDEPKILIISDSFGLNFFPFISESFGKTVKIWDNWEYKLNEDIVEKEKPDVVLLMIYEKNLKHLIGKSSNPE